VQSGTGQRAKIDDWEIAGKSGTTQAARDAWFIAFTGDYVTGVWMGYDDNRPLSGVTGGGLPADIWRETMTRVLAGQQPTPLPMQAPVAVAAPTILEGETDNIVADQVLQDLLNNILNGN
jgi:membrane peptidoglycan carboxypeptidase